MPRTLDSLRHTGHSADGLGRRARNRSPEQLTTVQDPMAALRADLANRAAAGDARAKQALQLMQQSTRW